MRDVTGASHSGLCTQHDRTRMLSYGQCEELSFWDMLTCGDTRGGTNSIHKHDKGGFGCLSVII